MGLKYGKIEAFIGWINFLIAAVILAAFTALVVVICMKIAKNETGQKIESKNSLKEG